MFRLPCQDFNAAGADLARVFVPAGGGADARPFASPINFLDAS
jgi:hypothetical protein